MLYVEVEIVRVLYVEVEIVRVLYVEVEIVRVLYVEVEIVRLLYVEVEIVRVLYVEVEIVRVLYVEVEIVRVLYDLSHQYECYTARAMRSTGFRPVQIFYDTWGTGVIGVWSCLWVFCCWFFLGKNAKDSREIL